jgi:phosphatidylserine decarboxylase
MLRDRFAMDPRLLLTLPGVPRRALSRCAGFWARRRLPLGLRGRLWPLLCRRLGIERASVPGEWTDYATFLELFARPLPPGERPLAADDGRWLAPADGSLVACAAVAGEGNWVIKGSPYAARELLPGLDPALTEGWQALQIYLAPRDYHRFHAPCDLEVLSAVVEEGGLLPVDPRVVKRSWRVLQRNRRVLLHARTPAGERLALLFVGALNVGGMRFVFDATLGAEPWTASSRRYDPAPRIARGEELGRFELGSTVVLFCTSRRPVLAAPGGRCRARTPLLGAAPAAAGAAA